MKRNVLLLFALLLTTATMCAQFHITPEVGGAMFKTDYALTFKSEYKKATVSPRIGVSVDYSFTKDGGWGLSSGLYFYQKKMLGNSALMWLKDNGVQFFYLDRPINNKVEIADIEKIENHDFESRRSYLQLPVLAIYTWEFAHNSSLSLGVGPYIAWGIAGTHKVNIQEYDMKKEEFYFKKEEYSPFDYFYSRCEVGLSTMLSLEVNRWVTKVNYEMNLNRRDRTKDNLVSLGIGYKFSL